MVKIKEDVEAEPATEEAAASAAEPTKAELQDELRDAGLPVSGTKAELVERLDAAEDAATVAPARGSVSSPTAPRTWAAPLTGSSARRTRTGTTATAAPASSGPDALARRAVHRLSRVETVGGDQGRDG